MRRGKPPVTWRWTIPGGAQEIDETVREGALRELKEETAIDAEIIGLIDVVDAINRDDDGRVRIADPVTMMQAGGLADDPVLVKVSAEAEARLKRVAQALRA